jgi:2C-methyl-D-erythritol 2,4-cyclodiphosphate synthase
MKDALLQTGIQGVNIKAKTNEGMGFVGRGEGIAAYAVCLLREVG